MKGLSRFNPAKSLFFRVFLWFWLAALLIFLSSVWLAKQLDSEAKYQPLSPQQHKDLNPLTRKLQNQSSPLMLEVQGITFVGPSMVSANQTDYMLFLVKPRPGGSFRVIQHEYPEVFITFIISFSLGLCYLFVRGLLNPIAQLSLASKRMATGEMGVRVGAASARLDEIGQLGRDFNYMSEQVESVLNSQKRLLADISHELRSPLTRLQLSIGIALQQNETDMSANMLSALERIEKEARQIEDMIAQVLLLSRLDNQQPIQDLQTVSLEQVMTRMALN